MNRRRRGFTLMEVLVVVAILTILATIVGVKMLGKPDEAKVVAATATLRQFKTAISMYRLDSGTIPTQEQGLTALCSRPLVPPIPAKYSPDGYLDSPRVPLDPWGHEYGYVVEGSAFEIISYGADGEPGGEGNAADLISSSL